MDLNEFIKHGGSLEMATTIVKTNKLDVSHHKRNGLAKLDYDYDDRQKLAHYKGQYFDMMKSEYKEEKTQYVVTFTDNVADTVEKTFNRLENAMDYIDGLDDDDFTTYDGDNWDGDDWDEDDWDEDDWDCDEDDDPDEDEDDSDLEDTNDSDNSDDESKDDDEKSDSSDSDWVDPDEEDD